MSPGPGSDSDPVRRRADEPLTAIDDRRIETPEEFKNTERYVVRKPGSTVVYTGQTMTVYSAENDHLEEDEMSFKRWGGREEIIYQLEDPDPEPDPDTGADR